MAGPAPTEEIRFGKAMLRVQRQKAGWAGIVVGARAEPVHADSREDLIRKLEHAAARMTGEFVGWPEAIARFLRRHPEGFRDASYARLERDDKEAARKRLLDAAPLDAALEAQGLAPAVVRVFTAPRFALVNRFEVDRAKAMLTGRDGDAFLRAAAQVCKNPSGEALEAMRTIAAAHDALRWPVLTLLPWLWAPDRHVFIKPEESKAFARAVGHPFHVLYEAASPIEVYGSACDLAREVLAETAALGARDSIDVQGFVYVVCHPGLVRDEGA